jgi:enediyne biosynthesis protein E4
VKIGKILFYAGMCLVALGCITACRQKGTAVSEKISYGDNSRLFTLLSPQSTGINFSNDVVDGEKFNIFTYRNFYNGGGVSIGDINNDSLLDIYFISNQGKNRLYLNKGNFVFEDITDKAGVAGKMKWKTGSVMADVNGDGLLDIYVCNSGEFEPAERENELFINNGDLTFTDKAKEYNLNNSGPTTHAAFFDYDGDGDLDCFIVNNFYTNPSKIELYKKMRETPSESGDKLMRNDGNVFTDVTEEAGIYSSEIGFGNGIAIADINHDNLPDIYVANDFWERDYLYINLGNGKFREEFIPRFNYCSLSSMGGDIADINNDGNPDIFTTDMLPADNYRLQTTIAFDPFHLDDAKYRENFYYQIAQNCLHMNDGTGHFQEIGLLAGVAATDWSWGALIFDFENDGNKDIFVSNGIIKDIMDRDFLDFDTDKSKVRNFVERKGRFDYRDFVPLIPANPLSNYAFHNDGTLIFQDRAADLGLATPSFSNGAAYGDLDNDGDMDLVVNNENSTSFVYRNESNTKSGNHFLKVYFKGPVGNPFGIGAIVTLKVDNGTRTLQNYNSRGFESSTEPELIFGLGKAMKVNEMKVKWPDGKVQVITDVMADQKLLVQYTQAVPVAEVANMKTEPEFEEVSQKIVRGEPVHHENRYNDFEYEILLSNVLSTEGPKMVIGDVNGDRLEDFILLGAAGDPDKLFIQGTDGIFSQKEEVSFLKDKGFESTCGVLLDLDGDGDLDLMIGSGGNDVLIDQLNYIIRVYKNDGQGNFKGDPLSIPPVIGNFSTMVADDIDNDGIKEIFAGARAIPGNYGMPPQSYLLKMKDGKWTDIAPSSLGNIGMVTDAVWTDIDSEGSEDLVVVGDWMGIQIFTSKKGVLNDPIIIPGSNGWWTRVKAADLDGDGRQDLILGNWGLNSKFKATKEKPLTMYVNDFDNNGKSEFIINWYPPLDDRAYPFVQRHEFLAQLPGFQKSVPTYKAYGNMTYDSLFSSEVRQKALKYEAEVLESSVLWNEGGKFTLMPLPVEAQVSPVFGIAVQDFDGDGIKDIWMGGNFYSVKPQIGRYDASKGVLLKGSGKRTFTYQPQPLDGLYVKGEVRDASVVRSGSDNLLIVARNNDKVLMFERRK